MSSNLAVPLPDRYAAPEMDKRETSENTDRIQLHLVLPYKHEAATHPQIQAHLKRGYRIEQLQRVTDREVLVTLRPARACDRHD